MAYERRCTDPLGMFDSGVGGLTVLAQLQKTLPGEDVVYLGDTAFAPYGDKQEEEICDRALLVAERLYRAGVKALVIACNTATSAAVNLLRARFSIPVIGVEPAVLPALEVAGTGKVAVMATTATLQLTKFKELVRRSGREKDVIPISCPGLVELIERECSHNEIQEYLISNVVPRARDAKALVLGCTHYVLIRSSVEEVFPHLQVIDGNLGTLRHLKEVLKNAGLLNPHEKDGKVRLLTTGDEAVYLPLFKRMLERASQCTR